MWLIKATRAQSNAEIDSKLDRAGASNGSSCSLSIHQRQLKRNVFDLIDGVQIPRVWSQQVNGVDDSGSVTFKILFSVVLVAFRSPRIDWGFSDAWLGYSRWVGIGIHDLVQWPNV